MWFHLAPLFVLRRVTLFLWVPLSPRTWPLVVAFPHRRPLGGRLDISLSLRGLTSYGGVPHVFLLSLRPPRLVWQSPALHVAGPIWHAARRVRPPFGPLAWRPSPAVPSPCWSRTPRRVRGLRPPPGLFPCVPPRRVGRLLLGLGRSAPPRVVGVRRPMPAVPLAPAALRPLGLSSPSAVPSTCSSRPPAGPGGFAHPRGVPPCVPPGGVGRPVLGMGRPAPPRVVGFCRPMSSWPTAICPCVTLWLCVPPRPPLQGAQGSVLFSVGPPSNSGALSLSALAPYPGSPPRPLLTAQWGLTPAPPLAHC